MTTWAASYRGEQMRGPAVPGWHFALLGGAGGFTVELLSVYRSVALWQESRRTGTGKVRADRKSLNMYVDVPAHLWMSVIRIALGAGVAALLGTSHQIQGGYAALLVGFTAPSLLAQLGSFPQVANAIGLSSSPSAQETSSANMATSTARPVRLDSVIPTVGGADEDHHG